MNQSETIGKLAEALAKAQGQMKPATKNSDNPYFKTKYADLASVWEAVRCPLSSNGLSVVQTTEQPADRPGIVVKTTLLHSSGEWISGELALKPVKDEPQAIGAAITYGRRFGLAAITGMCSEDEDDDGNTASGHPVQKAVPATAVASPLASARVEMPRNGIEDSEEPVHCSKCDAIITDGIDRNGRPYTAARMVEASTRAFKQPLCYRCYAETKSLASNVSQLFGEKNVKVEAA
jgi:hypothetical protein